MRGNEQTSKQTGNPVLKFFIVCFYVGLFWGCSDKHFCDDTKNAKSLIKLGAKASHSKTANMHSIIGSGDLILQDLPESGNRACHRHGSDGQGGRVY